jgi:hypothetical protein
MLEEGSFCIIIAWKLASITVAWTAEGLLKHSWRSKIRIRNGIAVELVHGGEGTINRWMAWAMSWRGVIDLDITMSNEPLL